LDAVLLPYSALKFLNKLLHIYCHFYCHWAGGEVSQHIINILIGCSVLIVLNEIQQERYDDFGELKGIQ